MVGATPESAPCVDARADRVSLPQFPAFQLQRWWETEDIRCQI
jgi:hypothetical protein